MHHAERSIATNARSWHVWQSVFMEPSLTYFVHPARKLRALLFFAACLFGILPGCDFFHKSDPTDAANAFFSQLSGGKIREAYESAAFVFQAEQTLPHFEATVKDLGLADYSAITWTRRVVTGEKEASLDGEITRRDGSKIPLAITLVRDAGKWKIYALHTGASNAPQANASAAPPTENPFTLVGKSLNFNEHTIPPQNELVALVRDTLLQFNDGVRKKSLVDFYNSLANTWRQRLSEQRLERHFQDFIDKQIDISVIENAQPVFDPPPQIDPDGQLLVRGYFPTQPYRVTFSLTYIYELPKWKLYGIDLSLTQ